MPQGCTKQPLGNVFGERQWGPIETPIMSKHF